jgi:ABC-2 type transport system ATP-binding protein
MPATPVVEVQGVTKQYGDFTAVKDLSLTVPRGAVYGLLGPNGAGKTTTIRMIMSIIYPDRGKVALFGGHGSGKDLSHRIGYLPEERGLYKKMKVLDLLIFLAEIKGVARSAARAGATAWLERLELGEWALRKADDLSKGMQQKVQFIATVLHGPDLLILDEPFSGLDPVNVQVMKDTVVDMSRKGPLSSSRPTSWSGREMCDDHHCPRCHRRGWPAGRVGSVRRLTSDRRRRTVGGLGAVLRPSIVTRADN